MCIIEVRQTSYLRQVMRRAESGPLTTTMYFQFRGMLLLLEANLALKGGWPSGYGATFRQV